MANGEDAHYPVLSGYFDQVGADLLACTFNKSLEPEKRLLLASRYAALGTYSTISRFFFRTAKYIEIGSLGISSIPDADLGVDFVQCDVFEGPFEQVLESKDAGRAAAAELRVYSRSADATAASFFERASTAVEENGGQCPLLFEWSRATLFASVSDTGSLRPDQEEAAIRILITLAAQGVLSPDLSNPCDVWVVVSEYFSARTDYISGYVALVEATECAELNGSKLILGSQELKQRLDTLQELSR